MEFYILVMQASNFTYNNAQIFAKELGEATGDVFCPLIAQIDDVIKIIKIK